jgi:hypothetical protein
MARILQVDEHKWVFWCPACSNYHVINENREEKPSWLFDKKNLTVRPSVLNRFNPTLEEYRDGLRPSVCHLLITDGKIEYLGTSTHHLKGQIIELEDEI